MMHKKTPLIFSAGFFNSTIGNITGDFINNYAQATSSGAYGGAIYNEYKSTITSASTPPFSSNKFFLMERRCYTYNIYSIKRTSYDKLFVAVLRAMRLLFLIGCIKWLFP